MIVVADACRPAATDRIDVRMHSIDQVIAGNVCVGCGACAFARPDAYAMEMTEAGHWRARALPRDGEPPPLPVCPMADDARDETAIASALYPDLPVDGQIGRYRTMLAGHVTEGAFRARGGSGGMGSWLLVELLRAGAIDAVLHVKPVDPDANDGLLFRYGVSTSEDEILDGAKSRYYPIEMSGVLAQLRATPGLRYAVVGLPCFLKSIRLMQEQGLIAPGQVAYCIGLVCGHLKSRHFASYLAWQKDIAPPDVIGFDFRRKLMGRGASDYGFAVRIRPSESASAPQEAVWPMASARGRDWGEGLFKNPACEFCDDVLAECADIVIGDAWLPRYLADSMGTNIVVTRHAALDRLVADGMARGALALEPASLADIVQSQSSALRHRREGLAHRLARRRAAGRWAPRKRVAPKLAPNVLRGFVYDVRQKIADTSSDIFAAVRREGRPLSDFERRIAPLRRRYRFSLQARTMALKLLGFLRRQARRIGRRGA